MQSIYILGSGAMGCLWASYFDNQHAIHFIQRQSSAPDFSFRLLPRNKRFKASCDVAENIASPISRVIIATKAYDAVTALNSVQPCLAKDAQVLLLQNGLGSQQAILKQYPDLALYACSSTEGAYKQDAHTVVHAGHGENIIGPLNTKAQQNRLTEWLPTNTYSWHDNINQVLWRKFMINCAINPLTVIYQCQNGELISNPDYFNHMMSICQEIDQLTQAKGYQEVAAIELAQQVCKKTANNYSSMLQDTKKGHQTEIDFMTGFFIEEARKHQIAVPFSQAAYDAVTKA